MIKTHGTVLVDREGVVLITGFVFEGGDYHSNTRLASYWAIEQILAALKAQER